MNWEETTVGFDEAAWTATAANGKQYVLLFDDENDPQNPGWIVQTVEIEDGAPIVVDCGILDCRDSDDVETAMDEAEQYLGLVA